MSTISTYFNNFLSYRSGASSKADLRTFEEKFTGAREEGFEYMKEASECPDLPKGIKGNDHALATPAGQFLNAKGEFVNGLGHAAYSAGNIVLAGSHGAAVVTNLYNTFAVVTHIGSLVNEAKILLGAGVGAEKLLHNAQDAYDRLVGNPVKPHEPTKLEQVHNFVKQADDVFHENTGYLTMGLNAIKTYFYPENFVGFFSRSGKAITNAYQAVKCEVNAAAALVKAGYYKAADLFGKTSDNSSEKTTFSEMDSSDADLNDPAPVLTSVALPNDGWEEIDLSGADTPLVFIS